ncbi:MAG: 2-oxoglutarate dehydrogenase, E2 component, dihydrolipoamide succinyltransferase [Ignavibacterium sp.]|nr:2-oxoglutarate dehydrogenase, E2 component, dihydrolipoamide succinyltransferase [Ignavibacterium sp.]MDW8375150.1 2-oxoglutarate dehydrogenase, E2 component, dihydrolipoamide succinyltransferase [Ignavibacteriales bacterium]
MEIIMPKMGESVTEGTIIKWHKKIGEKVKRDEILFEISTDKVDTESPSPSDGVLTDILVQEGKTVEVGTVVAILKTEESVISNEPEKDDVSLNELNNTNFDINHSDSDVIDITMPKMGESVMEGTIIKWHKKVGDFVKKDEVIFEISTDKVDTEIPSPQDGFLIEILVEEQKTVEVGTVVARLSSKNVQKPMRSIKPKEIIEQTPQQKIEEPISMHDNFSRISEDTSVNKKSSRFYSPLVLSIAEKENISFAELESIEGTGLEGRVTKKDVLNFLENRKSKQQKEKPQQIIQKPEKAVTFSSAQSHQTFESIEYQKIPMDNIRMKIMEHMIHSRDTSVHVTGMIEADVTRIHNFIKEKKDYYLEKENVKLTYMAFIADAVIKALKKYPLVNSSIDGNTIIQKKNINLGIAVAIEPTGLIVPNIKNAGDKNLIGLARAIQDLANRSRAKRLTPDDISFGTFTITNYGVFGTVWGTPIINQPEVAILGVGAVRKIPVVIEVDGTDTIAIRNIMALTLSHDHRLIDGMLGGLFLKEIKENLENFDFSKIY